MIKFSKISVSLVFMMASWVSGLTGAELLIGTAVTDITPKLPVALAGQFHLRIAQTAETPLTANAIALESRDGSRSIDAAVMVSCDLVGIPNELLNRIRTEVHKQITDLEINKIILNATHTHTAPVLGNDINSSFRYNIPKTGVTQVDEYNLFFVKQVTEVIIKAWKNRRPGSVTWGLSHAEVAFNRRVVYSDGTAQMYGKTNVPEFINLEGIEDHDVNILFFWDKQDKLTAMTIDVPCTAQEVEHRYTVNADYWHPLREKLRDRFGSDLCILGWISAAGDQSPHPVYRKAAEERMTKLRDLSRLDEIARRIVMAVDEAYETIKSDRHADVTMIHKVDTVALPLRLVTEEEYRISKAERDIAADRIAADSTAADKELARMTWNNDVLDRFEKQKTNQHPELNAEIHVLRIGDIVICTNEFELFTDYGLRMQARSNALQTFVIQLAAGTGTYLPTEKAVKGGGYSAVIQSSVVGPEGGQILVDRTVKLINDMFIVEK